MTALGIYLLSSMVFAVGALLEFAVVIVVDRVNSSKKEDVLKNSTQYTTSHYFDKQVPIPSIRMRNIAGGKDHLFGISENSLTEGTDAKTNTARTYFSVYKIDVAAFWSYFTIYLLFNVAYWATFLNEQ